MYKKRKSKVKLQSKGCANKREIKTCVTDGITGNKSRKLLIFKIWPPAKEFLNNVITKIFKSFKLSAVITFKKIIL